ncbi:hypothetical protein [Agathobacter sp.]
MKKVIENNSNEIINKYYNECLKFNGTLQQDFDIITAKDALAKLYELYKNGIDEGKFMPDHDYVTRAEELMTLVEENRDNKYYRAWRVWFRYFVSMGYVGWNELWQAVKQCCKE